MYGVARRPQRRVSLAGFGAADGGWEPMANWKGRVAYVTSDIQKAIARVASTAAAPAQGYFIQAQYKVNDAAAILKVEVDAGEWTRFREERISAKFAEARGLYNTAVGIAASLGVGIAKMSSWSEPGRNPNPPPTVTPTIVKVASMPPPVVTTPSGVTATPTPGGGIALVGQPGRTVERYPMAKILDQRVGGLPIWQWGVVGGVAVVGLGLAARVARMALFGGLVAGGAYVAKNWPKLAGLAPPEA